MSSWLVAQWTSYLSSLLSLLGLGALVCHCVRWSSCGGLSCRLLVCRRLLLARWWSGCRTLDCNRLFYSWATLRFSAIALLETLFSFSSSKTNHCLTLSPWQCQLYLGGINGQMSHPAQEQPKPSKARPVKCEVGMKHLSCPPIGWPSGTGITL